MSEVLALFRAGVLAEREFATTGFARKFGVEQWHARCEHLADAADTLAELGDRTLAARQYGRLAVASHILEGIEIS